MYTAITALNHVRQGLVGPDPAARAREVWLSATRHISAYELPAVYRDSWIRLERTAEDCTREPHAEDGRFQALLDGLDRLEHELITLVARA